MAFVIEPNLTCEKSKIELTKVNKVVPKVGLCCKAKQTSCCKSKSSTSCCKPNENNEDKECCKDICKCNHSNNILYNSTSPLPCEAFTLDNNAFLENVKLDSKNLHGFELLNFILQPPK